MAKHDDDEFRQWVKDRLRDLDSLTAKLPRGSLSGGVDTFDPLDPNTWWAPDAPEQYSIDAEQLYGITPDKVSDGLSQREKRELHAAGTKQIEGVTPERFRAEKREQDRFAKTSSKLWNTFRVTQPDYAGDTAAIRRAAQRLAAKNQLTTAEMNDMIERHPERVCEMIVDEMYDEPEPTSTGNQPEHRTTMPTDGGGYRRQQPSDDDAPSGDGLDGLRDWQKSTGWHR